MKDLTVLTLIDLNPRKFGTLEEYCLVLSQSLARRGHKSVLGFSEMPPLWLHDRYSAAGAVVEQIKLSASRASRLESLGSVILKHKVDILHPTHVPIFSPETILMKRLGVKRLIFSDQSSRVRTERSWLKDKMARVKNRFVSHWIDKIIADAEFIRHDLITDVGVASSKITVIYNGVNAGRFNRDKGPTMDKAGLGIPANHRVVTTVANCIPEKGLDVFLRAAEKTLRDGAEATFVIVGDGPLSNDLKQLALSLGISKNVVFLGLRDDVQNILAVSDIFVLCSMWEEAHALVILEAMASRLPVVATRIGAIPESVEEGVTGMMFARGDAAGAANAISALLNDEPLRLKMGDAGRRRAEDRFTLDRWVNDTVALYENLLKD
jgi:L-malate glycosyltransferase